MMRGKPIFNLLVALLLILGATALRPVAGCAVGATDPCCDHCDLATLDRAGCDATCQTPILIGGLASAPSVTPHRVSYVGRSSQLAGLDIAPDLPPPRGWLAIA